MYKEKLEDLKAYFYELYPQGFDDEGLVQVKKRHNTPKMGEQVHEMFDKNNFKDQDLICQNYVKVVSRSSMVSLFEKPKVRDMVKGFNTIQKDIFSIALYELLFGDKEDGFESLVEFLADFRLAKWSLISLVPYYYYRDKEFFIKPTTTKNIIKYFDIKEVIYKPRPSYAFYTEYKKILEKMKKTANLRVQDNAAFTGFLMISMEE